MKVTVKPIVIFALASHQMFGTGTGGLLDKRTSEDHPIYCNFQIGKNN